MEILKRETYGIGAPCFEVHNAGAADLPEILEWLQKVTFSDLPMRFVLEGVSYNFNAPLDLHTFLRGLKAATDLANQRPSVQLWSNYLDVAYIVLAFARDYEKACEAQATQYIRELLLAKSVEHIDDIVVDSGRLIIRHDVWKTLTAAQQRSMLDRTQGFLEGLECQD